MSIGSFDESSFAEKLYSYVSPAKPISSIEFLHGRSEALRKIQKALYADGRHIFIHGERGVGKSSLAQTAASQYQSADNTFILIECGKETTFCDVIKAIAKKAAIQPSEHIESEQKTRLSAKIFSHEITKRRRSETISSNIESMDAASDLMKDVATLHSKKPIVVIDEFDVIENSNERVHFSHFLKHLGDKDIPIKFILSGIGATLEELLGAHLSAIRQLETVKLDRLSWDARWEIVSDAAEEFGIIIDENILIRIAGITDGFPYYAHLIGEKLLWRIFESDKEISSVSIDNYYGAIADAIDGISPHLRRPYDQATQKRAVEYHHILWAVADAYDLQRKTDNIYQSYARIMKEIDEESMVDRTTFMRRLASLKKDSFGAILSGVPNRQGWYQYNENMVRGYVRMVAEKHGIPLQAELADIPRPRASQPRQKARHMFRRDYVPPISFDKTRGAIEKTTSHIEQRPPKIVQSSHKKTDE